ncbi:MAG: transglycosylase domain-containing protein [Methyloligellaceae bacterium]
MSFERLVDQILRRPWRRRGSGQPGANTGQYSSPRQNASPNDYAYPEHNSDLPEFIKSEINNGAQSDYDSSFGGKKSKNKEPRKRHWLLSILWPRFKSPEKPKYKRPPRPWYWAITVFVAYWSMIGAVWVTLGLVIAVTIYGLLSPDPLKAGLTNKPAYISIVAANGKVIAEKGLRRNHVKLTEMPPHVVAAVLATEDWRFYYHPGLDPIGIIRATIQNRRAGRIVAGGSTITQQLAKVLFLKPTRSYTRKIEEMLLSFWIEYRFSKDQILELYLNRIYFGAGNYGIEAAAQHYFGKSVAEISIYESAMLAGLIKSPTYYSPTTNFQRSLDRGKVVLRTMYNGWFISRKQYEQALTEPPSLRSYLPSESYGYIIDWVVERASAHGQNLQDDMIVETTVDYDLQGTAQRIVNENMAEHGEKYRAKQGALVILDLNGGVQALVGGRDYRKNQFNRIVQARRQPGSTFKPFIYLTAMEHGKKPDSYVEDSPIRIGNWEPKNYSKRYYGEVTMRDALAKSLNTAAVRLSEWVGRDRVIKTAHRLGIATKLHNNPSIALGTAEVSPLEITAAYASFANGGFAVQPHIITRIKDKSGNVLYQNKTKNWGRVIRPHYVAAMNDMLTTTVISGTAQKAALDPHQVAGKTGTGQGYRDAWFIGYTGHYIGGVWIGNDDFKPMKDSTGGALPAMIWHDIMQYAHLNKQPKPLPGGNWKNQEGQWASEERPGGRRKSFWGSIFGSSSDVSGSGSESHRRKRDRQRKEFEDIFGNDF